VGLDNFLLSSLFAALAGAVSLLVLWYRAELKAKVPLNECLLRHGYIDEKLDRIEKILYRIEKNQGGQNGN
jgi:hypothetical protein